MSEEPLVDNVSSIATSKSQITGDLDTQKQIIEKQIDRLSKRILELELNIKMLESANKVIEQMAQNDPNNVNKNKYYYSMKNNIDTLAHLYSVVKEFEDVRFKYYKEMDDVISTKYKMIAIELVKIEKKINEGEIDFGTFVEKLNTVLQSPEKKQEITTELNSPDYKL